MGRVSAQVCVLSGCAFPLCLEGNTNCPLMSFLNISVFSFSRSFDFKKRKMNAIFIFISLPRARLHFSGYFSVSNQRNQQRRHFWFCDRPVGRSNLGEGAQFPVRLRIKPLGLVYVQQAHGTVGSSRPPLC